MSIQLVTYANQTVTPTNDAIIYEKAVDQNGIFYGCNVTVTSNNVNITGGYGIVCGREFVINSESIAVTLAPSGALEGRLYVRLDLADADAPIQLLTATGNTLPPLVQDDDVNYTNGVYEMELATFTVGVSSLSDVVETFEEVEGTYTKLLNKLPRVQKEEKTLSFASGRGYIDMNYTLPMGATLLLGVLNGRPNPDWISADISAIGVNSCRISYNNTYSSTLSGTVTLKLLYTL